MDFGTTYCLVSQIQKSGHGPHICTLTSLIPSVMIYGYNKDTKSYEPYFFHDLYETNPQGQTIYDLLCTKALKHPGSFGDVYDIFHGGENLIVVASIKRLLTPQDAHSILFHTTTPFQVACDLFQRLHKEAQKTLKTFHDPHDSEEELSYLDAIVTVPAYFSEPRRQLIKKAAHEGSWKVLRLLSEPSSAALHYLHNKDGVQNYEDQKNSPKTTKDGLYVVYDLGGGTFDVSLLKQRGPLCRVLQTKGHTHLGGDDLDDFFAQCFEVSRPEGRLLKEGFKDFYNEHSKYCEQETPWGELLRSYGESKGFRASLENIENLRHHIMDFWQKTWTLVLDVLQEGSIKLQDLQGFLLTGGSSFFPVVFQEIHKKLKGACPLVTTDFHQSVSKGAAIHGENLLSQHQFLFLDVTPLSLGIETLGGLVERLISRGSPLPAKGTMTFTTGADYQQWIHLHILQGEGELVDHCFSLGRVDIPVEPKPKGHVRVKVVFCLNEDGLLKVQVYSQGDEEREIHTMDCWAFEDLEDKKIHQQIDQEGHDLFQRWWKDLEQKISTGLKEIKHLWALYGGENSPESFGFLVHNIDIMDNLFAQAQKKASQCTQDEEFLELFQNMKEKWDNFSQETMEFLNYTLEKQICNRNTFL